MALLSSRMRSSIGAILLAVGALIAPAAPVAAAWQASDDDALLFDVRAGKYSVGSGVRGYQTDNGACVDFADIIMALDLPVRLDKKSRRATGWMLEEQRLITIDRDQNRVQIMNKSQLLSDHDIHDTPEGWCIATDTLAKWMNIEIVADQTNALLILKADRKLPFEAAEERKERAGQARPIAQFNLESLPQANDPYRFWRTPSVDVVITTTARRSALSGTRLNGQYELLASGEIAQASYDARLSSNAQGVPNSLRLRAYRNDPKAGLLGPLGATQIAVGDVTALATPLGAQSTNGRGAFVSNRPLDRADTFDRTSFRGDLPEGWDAELYHNAQLIAFLPSKGDGRYEFLEVPLQYGQNRFEVVLYGPQGQIRRDVRLVPVGLDSIPPRKTYYWAGVQDAGRDFVNLNGQDRNEYAGWRSGIGVERGIDAKTSIGAAFTSTQFRGRRRNFLEASVRRALGPALLEISVASNLGRGYALRGQLLAQIGTTAISAEAALLQNGFQGERFELSLKQFATFSIDQEVKIAGTLLPLHFDLSHKKRINGDETLGLKTRTSFNISQLNITTEFKLEKDKAAYGPALPERLESAVRLSGRVGRVRLRGEAQFALSGAEIGFRETKLTAEWRSGTDAEWRTELGYEAKTDRGRIGVGYTKRFEKFAVTGQAEALSDGSVSVGAQLAFSFGPKPTGGGFRMSSEKLAATGQALATVFQDDNGDGIRQPGEPVEKDVELTAGLDGKGKPTDGSGRTILEGLEPYHSVLIGIDSSTLSDPYMQPANSGIVVTPRPGIAIHIDLPLVAAGEIAGTLTRDDGKILSGVDVELLNKDGVAIKTVRSEYDGYYLFESVPYGRYSVRVAALSATIIGVKPDLGLFAELNRGHPMVEMGIAIAHAATRIADAGLLKGP
jgi:Carboxypeptidase regulatory-like domain